jgi:hypothetical protein
VFIGPCYELWAAPTGLSLGSAVPTTAVQYQTGANGAAEILRASMTQASSTTSTQTAATLARFGATPSSTMTAAVAGTTLFKQNTLNATTDATLGAAATAVFLSGQTEGTVVERPLGRGFNQLNGLEWLPSPEERILVPQNSATNKTIGIQIVITAASATWLPFLSWRELRGN